jgi:cytidine deaminase
MAKNTNRIKPMEALIEKMYALAVEVSKRAYAPYSKFPVGVCIESISGKLYEGCNVENASYPMGQCAEATAIGNMVVHGERSIRAILVVAPTEKLISPCGGCLQKLSEFVQRDTKVILCNFKGLHKEFVFSDLYPQMFSVDDMAAVIDRK